MRIVADRHIPFLAETIRAKWREVEVLPLEPEQIDAHSVREADVLVVRTRTKVNEGLLSGSRVRLVCTATIGYDHIDTAWCEAHGVRWMSCPGCNAQAVCDYVKECINDITDYIIPGPIGVVGVGHVGSKVAKMIEDYGLDVLLCDPPKGIGVPLEEIAYQCDVITFHVPLTREGLYPTYHLCGQRFLDQCRRDSIIINASRGGVVDEQVLVHSGHPYILDTWEGEPDIDHEVLQHAFRASTHIAGYSVEGKQNATKACLDAISHAFGLPVVPIEQLSAALPPVYGDSSRGWLKRCTEQLKAHPGQFEQIRKQYILR